MEKAKSTIGPWRIAGALILSFFFLGILIPNTGRIVVDRSTVPPTYTITGRSQQIAMLVGMLIAPLACIYFGARRSRLLEYVGWCLLVGLFVLATQK
jgi:hypothetical protein